MRQIAANDATICRKIRTVFFAFRIVFCRTFEPMFFKVKIRKIKMIMKHCFLLKYTFCDGSRQPENKSKKALLAGYKCIVSNKIFIN